MTADVALDIIMLHPKLSQRPQNVNSALNNKTDDIFRIYSEHWLYIILSRFLQR